MEVWRASQESLEVVIVNPGVILGPGYWNNGTGKLFTTIYNGFKYYTEGVTGFVNVNDVVRSMLLLMKSTIKNERFILVSENVSFKTILVTISENLGVKKPTIKVSKLMSELAWRIDWLKSTFTASMPLLTKHSARAGHRINYYSSDKLKKAIDFEFNSVNETIRNITDCYIKDIN